MNYRLEVNTHFEEVMKNCQTAYRPDQGGTWINNEMIESYQLLHKQGWASSASLWDGEEMIGGLYGIQVGTVFCGESMFHKVSDASKICFTLFVQDLIEKGIKIIDCQVYTEHLSSLGAEIISRDTFISYLSTSIS